MQKAFTNEVLSTRLLNKLQQRFLLTPEQVELIAQYSEFLLAQNLKHNLTGHRELPAVLRNLFADSLEAGNFIDFTRLNCIGDVGTGAGFPGLALKIAYPHLKVVLIEVNQKKLQFLRQCIEMFNLTDVSLVEQDWRTFNRHNAAPIELFVTKAAFDEVEACRMFRQNSLQKDKPLLYWTTTAWQCDPAAAPFCRWEQPYGWERQNFKFALFSATGLEKIPFIAKKASQ